MFIHNVTAVVWFILTDSENRNFVVIKFSMIKTLKEDEAGFHLTGDHCQLG